MASGKEYTLALKIAGKVDASFKKATKEAQSSLTTFSGVAKNTFKGIAVAGAAVTAALGAVTVAAVKSAAEYESQLANVSTLLTGTEEQVAARTAEIGESILEVSNRTGVATADLTDGMYQVVSAFGDSADAAAQLEVAAKAAAAGNATTTDAINLLSAVTKGYGDTSAEAVQKAADLSFATVRLGQTSFPELAAAMGKVIPLASTLGVEQEQLFGAMATLTGVTGSTSEVVTQLKATMQGFLSPSAAMTEALSSLGYESGQALLESKGLQGALDLLKGSVNGDELAFAKLFSSVEAQTAVLAMAGTQADNLTQKTAEMYEATGAADAAFERQTDTLEYTIASIKNLGQNFLTELGTNILPYVREVAEAALPLVTEALSSLSESLLPLIGNLMPVISSILPTIISAVEEIIPLAESFIPVIAEILPLLGDMFEAILPTAVQIVRSLLPLIMQLLQSILPPIISLIEQLLPPLMQIIDAILPVVQALITAIAPILTTLMTALQPILNVVIQLITPLAGIIEKLAPIITLIGNLVTTLITALSPAISTIANLLGAVLGAAFTALGPIIDGVTAIFGGLIDFISNIFSGNWSAAWESIVGVFGNVFGTIVNIAKAPINAVISAINWCIEKINGISVTIPDWVPLLGGQTFGFNIPTIPMLAEGGIATQATLAEIGEGAEPEAVLPLSKLAEMLDGAGAGGDTYDNRTNNQSKTVTFAPVFNFYGNTTKEQAEEAGRISFAEFKRLYQQMQLEERRKVFA